MLLAVNHLHSMNILHRDIKFSNFLLRQNKETGVLEIQLTDFGLACEFDPEHPPTTKCGTLTTVAPELFLQEHYDMKADTWSLGIMLYKLLSGRFPFNSENDLELKNKILYEEICLDDKECWQAVSDDAKDLLLHLMDREPGSRYTVQEAMDHWWFADLDQKSQCKLDLVTIFKYSTTRS